MVAVSDSTRLPPLVKQQRLRNAFMAPLAITLQRRMGYRCLDRLKRMVGRLRKPGLFRRPPTLPVPRSSLPRLRLAVSVGLEFTSQARPVVTSELNRGCACPVPRGSTDRPAWWFTGKPSANTSDESAGNRECSPQRSRRFRLRLTSHSVGPMLRASCEMHRREAGLVPTRLPEPGRRKATDLTVAGLRPSIRAVTSPRCRMAPAGNSDPCRVDRRRG